MSSTRNDSSPESAVDAALALAGEEFAGLRVATGTRYKFQWHEANRAGTSGWAQVVHASPRHPHNHMEGTLLRVHRCNYFPCGSASTGFHVLQDDVCDWCGRPGYDRGSFEPRHRHLVPHMGVLVLHWLGGFLRCESCVDLDEPPHSPNNRQRFAARLLHNNVLPVAARVEPVCALIAKFVVENSA